MQTEAKVYELKQRHDLIKDVECIEEENVLEEEGKENDPMWWRRALFAYSKKRRELKEFEEQRRIVLDKWDKAHSKRKEELSSFEAFLQSQLMASKYKTKTGGYKFDMAPDIGVISIDKPRTKYIKDNEYWVEHPEFTREVVTKKVDTKAIDTYLSQFKVFGDRVIDNNGEVVPGVTVEQSNTFRYKETEYGIE